MVLAGAGDGSAKKVHAAVQAAVGSLRSSKAKRMVICLPAGAGDDAVRAAVSATAESSYVYVATKSKPEARELQRVTIAVADAKRAQGAFAVAKAAANGIEFAREVANLPPNHATPTRLGEEAKKLAKAHGFQCEVLGPKEVAKIGMGSFMARGQGLAGAAALHRAEVPGRGGERSAGGAGGQGHHLRLGGISIKPSADMDEMKFDMGGAVQSISDFPWYSVGASYLPVPIGGLITALFVIERLWVSNLFEQPSDDAISTISTE